MAASTSAQEALAAMQRYLIIPPLKAKTNDTSL